MDSGRQATLSWWERWLNRNMIDGLRVEDRNGVIVLCASMRNPFTNEDATVPLLAFADMDALKRHNAMIQEFIDKNDIPHYIKDAFNE